MTSFLYAGKKAKSADSQRPSRPAATPDPTYLPGQQHVHGTRGLVSSAKPADAATAAMAAKVERAQRLLRAVKAYEPSMIIHMRLDFLQLESITSSMPDQMESGPELSPYVVNWALEELTDMLAECQAPAPTVAAQQPAPTVAAQQPAPTVAAQQPAPTVAAQQPAPTVAAQQPAPAPTVAAQPAPGTTPLSTSVAMPGSTPKSAFPGLSKDVGVSARELYRPAHSGSSMSRAAFEAGSSRRSNEYGQSIRAAQAVRAAGRQADADAREAERIKQEKAEAEPWVKPKASQRRGPKVRTAEQVEAGLTATYDASVAHAGVGFAAGMHDDIASFAALADSPDARAAEPGDAEWAIQRAGDNLAAAKALLALCAQGERGRAVAQSVSTRGPRGLLTERAEVCLELLGRGIADPPDHLAQAAGIYLGLTDDGRQFALDGIQSTFLIRCEFMRTHQSHAVARAVGAKLGPDRDDLGPMISLLCRSGSTSLADAVWLCSHTEVPPIVELLTTYQLQPSYVREIVELGSTRTITAAAIVGLLRRFPKAGPSLKTVILWCEPELPYMVEAFLELGAAGRPNHLVTAAVKAEAQLRAGEAGVLGAAEITSYSGGERHQARNADLEAKTGIVKIAGTDYDVHAHWRDQAGAVMSSIHLKYRMENGPELHTGATRSIFSRLIAKSVEKLNAARGASAMPIVVA